MGEGLRSFAKQKKEARQNDERATGQWHRGCVHGNGSWRERVAVGVYGFARESVCDGAVVGPGEVGGGSEEGEEALRVAGGQRGVQLLRGGAMRIQHPPVSGVEGDEE
jgi:hypothetical protein